MAGCRFDWAKTDLDFHSHCVTFHFLCYQAPLQVLGQTKSTTQETTTSACIHSTSHAYVGRYVHTSLHTAHTHSFRACSHTSFCAISASFSSSCRFILWLFLSTSESLPSSKSFWTLSCSKLDCKVSTRGRGRTRFQEQMTISIHSQLIQSGSLLRTVQTVERNCKRHGKLRTHSI